MKIIGLSTDSAPSMTGCNVGFTTQLASVVIGGKLYQVWGLAHQLDLIIKARMHAISDTGDFTFVQVATTIVGHYYSKDGEQVPLLHQNQVDFFLKIA